MKERHVKIDEEMRILDDIHSNLSKRNYQAKELAKQIGIPLVKLNPYTKFLAEQGFVTKQKTKNKKGKAIIELTIPQTKALEFGNFVSLEKNKIASRYLETPLGKEVLKFILANKRVTRQQLASKFHEIPYDMLERMLISLERDDYINIDHTVADKGLKYLAEKIG